VEPFREASPVGFEVELAKVDVLWEVMVEPSITVVTTTMLVPGVVFAFSVVDGASLVDEGGGVEVDEGGVVLCGVLEGVDEGAAVLEEAEVELGGGVDDDERELVELMDEGVDVAAEVVPDPVSDPTVMLKAPVTADTIPPSRPPSLLVSCRRWICASNQFACAMAKIKASTESNRR